MPKTRADIYIQAQMDLGATVCTRSRPHCDVCPVSADCVARAIGRTAELPAARPHKALPARELGVLLLRHMDRILLEPRPAAGIWGGLWSLPEFDADPAVEAARCGCRIIAKTPLEEVAHTFTHFRLHIRPLLCEVEMMEGVAESCARWIGREDLASAPLPAPIRKLLAVLLDQPVV